jgi:hypothetical protein
MAAKIDLSSLIQHGVATFHDKLWLVSPSARKDVTPVN